MRTHSSPNHDARPPGRVVDMLVVHYTGLPSRAAALDRLCDPSARVSAHYLIDEDGAVVQLVTEDRRAWHAGEACWAGERDVNGCSLGIELVNPGHQWGYRPFAEAQMAALVELAGDIVARHAIPPERVLGHADVAPARRKDPGELFDWVRLARAGIGLVARPGTRRGTRPPGREGDAAGGNVAALQRRLARFGYDIAATGRSDALTAATVTAFQRHFRQARVDGVADRETEAALEDLVAQLGRGR